MGDIFEGLNEQQIQAVKHIDGPMLILAGAGSGKTKTITSRLAYLIDEIGIHPSNTLTLTFTNKASEEMKARAMGFINSPLQTPPLLCTFHKFGLLFLRFYINKIDRKADFVLIDSSDCKRILKSIDKSIPAPVLISHISNYKNQNIFPQEALAISTGDQKKIAKIYEKYNQYLALNNLLDFDDLIMLTNYILDTNKDLREQTSQKYQYIMVDEYQDTNMLQYLLLKNLTSAHQNICVVGDDDQSIYGWRGADIRNILEFEKDFSNTKIIKLEQNYRSTTQILQIANNLIAHNNSRLGKNLISTKGDGEEVRIKNFDNEKKEISFISKEIKKIVSGGARYEQIALLYRLNSLSRNIEEEFNREKIPYRLIGSIKFYERAEIKDIISYFRLIVNFNDDFSFFRVINCPRRGFGEVSQKKIENLAKQKNLSVYEYLQTMEAKAQMGEKNFKVVSDFFGMLKKLSKTLETSATDFLNEFEKDINVLIDIKDEYEMAEREANIKELYGKFREFMQENSELTMQDFLNEVSLSTPLDENFSDGVSCMSIHSSKGLEFDYVFIVGFEDGIFPLLRTDGIDIDEERRLGYVAFTRAKNNLCISYTNSRLFNGKREYLSKSRFLKECITQENIKGGDKKNETMEIQKGSNVKHKIFGTGRVMELEGSGINKKVKANFGGNIRVIMASFLEVE